MKILAIKFVTTKSGNKKILITTATGDVWVTIGQWKSAGASSNLDMYVGGTCTANYFAKGELLFDGETECTQDNTILHSVFVSGNPQVLAEAKVVEDRASMQDASDMSALFARKRVEAKALAQTKANASKDTVLASAKEA